MSATAGLAALLAMIAGYVDAYGYLTYRTFLSFMSGNTTITGYSLGQGHLSAATPSLVAIIAFGSGATIGSAISRSGDRQSRRIEFAVVAAIQSVVIVTATLGAFSDLFRIAAMSLAMGILNSSVARVGAESVSVTFVTGTLSKIGNHLALALKRSPLLDGAPSDTHAQRAAQLAGIWSAFLLGALLAGMATPHFAEWTLVPAVAILFALSIFRKTFTPARDDA